MLIFAYIALVKCCQFIYSLVIALDRYVRYNGQDLVRHSSIAVMSQLRSRAKGKLECHGRALTLVAHAQHFYHSTSFLPPPPVPSSAGMRTTSEVVASRPTGLVVPSTMVDACMTRASAAQGYNINPSCWTDTLWQTSLERHWADWLVDGQRMASQGTRRICIYLQGNWLHMVRR